MKGNNKIWFSFISSGKYGGDEPAFFNVKSEEWYKLLLDNWEKILSEFITSNDDSFVPYFNNTFSNKKSQWKFLPFRMWGVKYVKNCNKYPVTYSIIKDIPYLASAAFSKLNSDTRINKHVGDTNIMYRVHVPLVVPKGLPQCGFKVLDEEVPWEPGVIFAFCDAHEHEAWNDTNQERVILILDIIRPEFQNTYFWNRAQLTASLWFQFAFQKTNLIRKIPNKLKFVTMNVVGCFAFLYIPIHNFLGKIFYK